MEYFQLKTKTNLAVLLVPGFQNPVPNVEIVGLAQLGIQTAGYLTFCDRPSVSLAIKAECRSVILVSEEFVEIVSTIYPNATTIIAEDPRATFIDVVQFFLSEGRVCHSSLLPTAPSISTHAVISERACIEPGVQIDEGVTVAAGAVIRAGTWLQSNTAIGENSVIGAPGIFVYVGKDGIKRVFPHLGGVLVETGATLGAGCVVPKGILCSTRIGAGSIIGNLCNIGHGAEVGANTWISSSTAIGGQTKIGTGSTIALGSVIRDNVDIGDCANIGMGSVVTKNVRSGQSVFGNPARSVTAINVGPKR